jgi:PAS domain S-box-containing protein
VLNQVMDASVIQNVNRRMVEMFGAHHADELMGTTRRIWQRSPEAYWRGIESRFRGEEIFQEEMEVETLDGRVINVVVTVARPEAVGALGINFIGFVDISDRVKAIEMLQRVQAEFAHAARVSILGELAASIAHEINQPLAAIMTNAEAALRWLNRPQAVVQKAGDAMQRIVGDARRAADIISRVRAMAGGRVPKPTALSLHEVVADAIAFLSHEIRARSVQISLEVPETLPRLSGDRIQLQQVVVNLVINAIQAMHQAEIQRPALLIRSSLMDDETVRCTFEDGGRGIDADHLGRLFDSFFTTKESGMGMGLAVSRSIIEAHGGRLLVDNESALGGARFTMMLPTTLEVTKH